MRVKAARMHGFTLVELIAALALMGILLALAAPSLTIWIRNAKVRATTESLQNSVRFAQAEAVRRNRTVLFFLTNATPALNAAPAATGLYWGVQTLPLLTGGPAELVRSGAVAAGTEGVTVTADSAAICFSPLGRQTANTGAGCALNAATLVYKVAMSGAERSLWVTTSIGGQVRMCDPNKIQSSTGPDGCPAALPR